MNKFNIFTIIMLLNLNINITASWKHVSQDPQEYLDGHYIYQRYAKRRNYTQDQVVIYPLPRHEISQLESTVPYNTFWACHAGVLQDYHFPEKSRGHLTYCFASQLNAKLQEELTKAEERDVRLAKQYIEELQTFQFIKRQKDYNLPQEKQNHKFPGLHERPQINPFGPIGPKSLPSPKGVTDHRLHRSCSQDKNN